MRKGISPIVAVVLLIAIAVIAAVGLYFWVGGLATKQPTPSTPKTVSAYAVSCGSANYSVVMIANISPPSGTGANDVTGMSEAMNATSTGLTTSSGAWIFDCSDDEITPGSQVACKVGNNGTGGSGSEFAQGSGTISIFGSNIASAIVTC